jgi:hypothetical protein
MRGYGGAGVTAGDRLLRAIDRLAYPDRQRQLAATARRLAGTVELDVLLADLYDRGGFARHTGVLVARVAGHLGYVVRCMSASEPGVRAAAVVAAVELGVPAAAVGGQLSGLPLATRRVLYRAVRRHRSTALAAALVPVVRSRYGDAEAAALLPSCPPEMVAALLPDLDYAVGNWAALARAHPGVFVDHVEARLAAEPRAAWAELGGWLGPGLGAVAPLEPARLLAVLERGMPELGLPYALDRTVAALARYDPGRTLALLVDRRLDRPWLPTRRRALCRALLGVEDGELAALGRVLAGGGGLARFLHLLPPARRAAVYAGVLGRRDRPPGGYDVLDELPAAAREAEARRLLGLPAVVEDRAARLAVTARLPWAEAAPQLHAATRRQAAGDRATAYPLLVAAAAATRDPAEVAELVGSLTRLPNEQDPVRAGAVWALSAVPPWLYRETGQAALTALLTGAVQARDSSAATRRAVEQLSLRLVVQGARSGRPELVGAGLAGLDGLGQYVNGLRLPGLDRALPAGAEHTVFATLEPRIVADARRDRFDLVFALAHGLGRRGWAVDGLQRRIDQARGATADATAEEAITLWLTPPATRDTRVERVLRADQSAIAVDAVRDAVGLRRTDLLDSVLSKPAHGRFIKRGVRLVPWFRGVERWLPRQTDAYGDLLADLATTGSAGWEQVAAVRRLGTVPGGTGRLRGILAATRPGDRAVIEAALTALGRTDEPALALPALLAATAGDHAHIAVRAAGRAARQIQPAALVDALTPLLSAAKITTRKEAALLLAAHRVPAAADLLAAAWAAQGQHRDVRHAIAAAAARHLLDDERAWALLADAATAPYGVVTAVLNVRPHLLPERHRGRFGGLVRIAAGAADLDTAQLALAVLPRWYRWDPPASELLVDAVTDLDHTGTWRHAVAALVHVAGADGGAAPVTAAAARLLDAAGHRRNGRDLPARQRLLELAAQLTRTAHRPPAATAAVELATLLTADPTLRRPALDLAVAAIRWDATGLTDALRGIAALADRPALAPIAGEQVRLALSRKVDRLATDTLTAVAATLAGTAPEEITPAHDHPATAHLALGIARAVGAAAGWTPELRLLVSGLRDHPDPDVRTAALDTFTQHE